MLQVNLFRPSRRRSLLAARLGDDGATIKSRPERISKENGSSVPGAIRDTFVEKETPPPPPPRTSPTGKQKNVSNVFVFFFFFCFQPAITPVRPESGRPDSSSHGFSCLPFELTDAVTGLGRNFALRARSRDRAARVKWTLGKHSERISEIRTSFYFFFRHFRRPTIVPPLVPASNSPRNTRVRLTRTIGTRTCPSNVLECHSDGRSIRYSTRHSGLESSVSCLFKKK